MDDHSQPQIESTLAFDDDHEGIPDAGGGLPVLKYWAEHTLSPKGFQLWKTLLQ